jgi:hypothetical protein
MKKIIFIISILLSFNLFAWGNRGHHTLCQAATFLVKNPNLRQFFKRREHTFGHLCNVPDIYWKTFSKEERKLGDPTHYLHAQSLNPDIKKIPLDYAEALKLATEEDVGSLWWRADQFYRLAQTALANVKNTKAPQDFKEMQDSELPYNQSVYSAMVAMGIMGHYVGDGSMPYHNHSDYDGWGSGHGTIHGFYEDECVAEMPPGLLTNILIIAKKNGEKLSFLKTNLSNVERMKELALLTVIEVAKIEKLDPMIKPSTVIAGVKTPATRKDAAKSCSVFYPMITKQMAYSARLLAKFWDQMYESAQKPDLIPYRSYRYPAQPEFVAPDYLVKK